MQNPMASICSPTLLVQKTIPHTKPLYWRQGNKTALRVGDWKLVRHAPLKKLQAWQLFNLKEDLAESNDLAPSQPQKLAELIEAWEAFNAKMAKPAFR